MDAPAEADLLQVCPYCDYRLTGLPVEHRCPECGNAFDRRWRVFGRRSLWNTHWRIPMAIVLAFFTLLILYATAFGIYEFKPDKLAGAIGNCVYFGGLYALLLYGIFSRPQSFIAVGPDDLMIYYRRNRCETMPWRDINSIQLMLASKSIGFTLNGQQKRIRLFTFFRGDPVEADRCVKAMKDAHRSWASRNAATAASISQTVSTGQHQQSAS